MLFRDDKIELHLWDVSRGLKVEATELTDHKGNELVVRTKNLTNS